jgi:hypothetical protein
MLNIVNFTQKDQASLYVKDTDHTLYLKWEISKVLTPKGPMSVDGFLGSSGRLSRRQKHEWTSKILEEGRRI